MKEVCFLAGFNGREVRFSYDTESLAVVECEIIGEGPDVSIRVMREDGSQAPWERVCTDPGTYEVTGIGFAGVDEYGSPFGVTFTVALPCR